jgi:hypothetical protein
MDLLDLAMDPLDLEPDLPVLTATASLLTFPAPDSRGKFASKDDSFRSRLIAAANVLTSASLFAESRGTARSDVNMPGPIWKGD